jgi:hypothetical protein
MPFGSVSMRALIFQTEQIRAKLRAERQQAAGPRIEDGGGYSLTRSMDGPLQNCATDHGPHGTGRFLVDRQCRGLGHEVARCRIEFAGFE